jgi:seryl-tRNA synthetase
MIDEKWIISNPEEVKEALLKRGFEVDFTEYLNLKELRNSLLLKIEEIRAKRNKLSKSIGEYKREKKDTTELFKEIDDIKDAIEKDEITLRETENKIQDFLYTLPNTPDSDLVAGDKENNEVIFVNKEKPVFDFEIKDHVDLATSLGLIDYERAAKISGRGTWIYSNLGARLASKRWIRVYDDASYFKL